MQEFKADILIVNKKGRTFFWITIGLVGLAILLLALFFIGVERAIFQLIGILGFSFACIKYYLQTRKQVLKKSVGNLCIGDNYITVNDVKFDLPTIKNIKIEITGWRTYQRSEDRSHPVTGMHTGDKNFLTIEASDGSEKCEFLLESEKHWKLLRDHVINWYKLRLNVTESVQSSKSYGLEVLNYAQIQEFKKLIANPKATE